MEVVETPLGTLRPTVDAAIKVNAKYGSFVATLRQVELLDFEAAVIIVSAGLNKQPKEVQNKVFAIGCADLAKPLSDFVTLLANGGRSMIPTDDDDKDNKSGDDLPFRTS